MKLWILRPKPRSKLWEPWYDKAFGFVVRAETKEQARALAQAEGGDEINHPVYRGTPAWTDAKHSTCEELTANGSAEVVMQDFHAA